MSKLNGFERKILPNGDDNPKYIDLLDEDKGIAGQKFACVSFVAPEELLKQKGHYYNLYRIQYQDQH